MTNKPLKTVDSILNLDVETSEMGKSFKLQQKADLYQLMLSLLPSQSKYKTTYSYKKAIKAKLSEHFNGEELVKELGGSDV